LQLIKDGWIELEDAPNVNTNPLPNHAWSIYRLTCLLIVFCLILLNKTSSVNELFLWSKIMCFPVFISHFSLLLLHVNNILSTTFAHKTTTQRILQYFPFFQNHT
jgi:hypothetical protein